MKLTQIRNATLLLNYAGVTFLIDPVLAEQGEWEGFAGTARSHLRNPLVPLPVDIDQLLNVDAVIVTHTHRDHWDEAAQRSIPRDKLIFTQNEQDAALIRSQQFTNVHVLEQENHFQNIIIQRTAGQHGSDEAYAVPAIAERLGEACGLVFQHPQEKSLYIAGDTIFVPSYQEALATYQPEVIVLNAGFAQVDGIGAIIMGKEDVLKTQRLLPSAILIASHMEAINHCILSRAELREYTTAQGIAEQVLIPLDGESLFF